MLESLRLVTDGCKLLCGCWGLNPGAEPSLQLLQFSSSRDQMASSKLVQRMLQNQSVNFSPQHGLLVIDRQPQGKPPLPKFQSHERKQGAVSFSFKTSPHPTLKTPKPSCSQVEVHIDMFCYARIWSVLRQRPKAGWNRGHKCLLDTQS